MAATGKSVVFLRAPEAGNGKNPLFDDSVRYVDDFA
jgi:hypothetical protein